MSTPRQLSIFDLKLVPGAIGIIQRNNKEELDHLLHDLGFDVRLGYDFEESFHRPLTWKTNEPQFGVRIVGTERIDYEWISGEHASWEAKTENIDPALRDDLIAMSRESNNTQEILNHISSKGE